MTTTLSALQKQRRDTASNWTSNNTVLLAGEWGVESDTKKFKIGDGSTAWQSLDYVPIPDTNRLLTGNLTVGGNFTVNGTTTTIDTTTLTVEDKNIEIGKVSTPSDTTADGGGITLKGATDKTINWVDSTDSWTLSEHLDLASGKVLKVAGTEILSATTLGSSVVSSSLTSVGTIATGVWQGTAIGSAYMTAGTTSVVGALQLTDSVSSASTTTAATPNSVKTAKDAADSAQTTANAALPKAGGQISGNITCASTQTVDGRDLSVDGSKLDGIEANADVTDATNVNSAGAIMESDVDAKGDLLAGTADNTVARLAVGTNGYVLKADSTAATGLAWAVDAGGIADVAADTSPQLGGDLQSNGNDIDFADNDKAVFGTSQDFQIYHDGTYNNFSGANFLVRNAAADETLIYAVQNGAAELWYDNSKKFETHSAGVVVSGNVYANDNNKFIAGTSNDLQIYHDGSNTQVVNNTGDLKIYSSGGALRPYTDQFTVKNVANNETLFYADANSAFAAYYDNSKKLETTSGGAKVTGFLNVTTGIHIPDGGNSDNSITIGSGNDLRLYHNGTNSFIDNSTGYLNINSNGSTLFLDGAGAGVYLRVGAAGSEENAVIATPNGAVELYYDNNKSLETTSDGGVKAQGNYIIGTSDRGLQFNASDSGSSQILDDYEEGTFNPEFGGTSSHGSFTYYNQDGYYTKIGNVVHIQIYVRINQTNSSGSGVAVVKNLPFGVDNGNNLFVGFGFYSGFSGKIPSYGVLNNGADYIYIRRHDPGSSYHQWMSTNDLANGTYIVLNCTYQTND